MKRWKHALRDALVSGAASSVVSTLVLALRGREETGSPYAPTNAISHWLWGDRAASHDDPSARHTAIGYAIHHAASVFWAVFYERWFGDRLGRGDVAGAVGGGAAVAALACFVDYRMTPHRLQPGYERRLSRTSLLAVYAAVGAGFVIGSALATRGR